MSDVVVMVAEARPGVGKGAARQTRREGYVPAVIYGSKKEPVTIRLQGNQLLKTLHKGGFFTTIFEIQVGGDSHHAIPKAIQKDKLNGLPTHVDFLRIERGALIEIEVPVHFVNHEASPGLKAGGSLNVARHVVELRVPNNAIPDSLTVDLTGLEIGDTVHISKVTLPKGAAPVIDRDFTVASIAPPAEAEAEGAAEA
ncbi:50S ribosomal protein L25/general stress protein Ctc [Neomegalonema sp.]|uniref:50S ribosomal protein L25/general stress protein Ctc n=1 Tax=Neomegalonema sp. TaxID=2039713 RepID=UPI00262476B6|nr:50S ribosomal protein L25/general stress protein Ctc [Neomegalonema sp.]MDD2867525.1 50S ribosomal protein L25/general stress protein Ctc [Neomegalonema sp.]